MMHILEMAFWDFEVWHSHVHARARVRGGVCAWGFLRVLVDVWVFDGGVRVGVGGVPAGRPPWICSRWCRSSCWFRLRRLRRFACVACVACLACFASAGGDLIKI